MLSRISVLAFAVIMSLGVTFVPEARAETPPQVAVSMEAARQAALARVPGTVQEEELEQEDDGRWLYEFDIQPSKAGDPVQEVQIDANTGQVVSVAADD